MDLQRAFRAHEKLLANFVHFVPRRRLACIGSWSSWLDGPVSVFVCLSVNSWNASQWLITTEIENGMCQRTKQLICYRSNHAACVVLWLTASSMHLLHTTRERCNLSAHSIALFIIDMSLSSMEMYLRLLSRLASPYFKPNGSNIERKHQPNAIVWIFKWICSAAALT